jgi:hypothetical protein
MAVVSFGAVSTTAMKGNDVSGIYDRLIFADC